MPYPSRAPYYLFNDGTDPIFRNPRMSHKELITWAIEDVALTHPPGEHYAYSNFGYCILGRVIEKLTGVAYDIGSDHCLFDAGIARSNTDDARPVLIGLSVRHGR